MPIKEDTESAGRKHPVPQNVMDVEFKVVGDLTVRQVMYLFIGGILIFIFFRSGLPSFWRWAFMIGTGGLSIAVAFVPIQERGMDRWMVSFVKALMAPTQRIWRKSYSPPAYYLSDYAQIIKNEIMTLTPAKSRNKLDEYLGQIQGNQSQLERDEIIKLQKIQNIYNEPPNASTKVLASQPTLAQKQANTTNQQSNTQNIQKAPTIKEIHEQEIQSKNEFVQSHSNKNKSTILVNQVDRTMSSLPGKLKGEISIKTNSQMPNTITIDDINELKKQEKELEKKIKEFMQMTDKAKKEFAKQSKNSNEKQNRENRISFFSKKLNELENEKHEIGQQINISSQKAQAVQTKDQRIQYSSQVENLQKQNLTLEKQLSMIQGELNMLKEKALKQDTKAMSPNSLDSQNYQKTQTSNSAQTQPNKPKNPQQIPNLKGEDPIDKATVTQAKITGSDNIESIPDDITTIPNVLQGIVKGKTGELLESAVVMIKDSEGDVIRALKTNKLGQFKTQTPLVNGKYTVEAIKAGEKFDIISVSATGTIIPPVKLIGINK